VGRIGPAAWKAGPILIDLLRDGYWKVRTAACIALASTGQQVADKAIAALARLMKDGSINRDNVAETIVRLGPKGEHLLIEMLNN
jgi:HEAT repeat protein